LIVLAVNLVSCSSQSRPSESVVVDAFSHYHTNIKIVEYGNTLVSEGYKAAKGTTLYPVKVNYTFNNSECEGVVYYFYRDEFGKWCKYKKE